MKNNKLTNKDIYENYSNNNFHLMLPDFLSSFAFGIAGNAHRVNIDLNKSFNAFKNFLQEKYFPKIDTVRCFTFHELENLISENIFIAIPEILELNKINSKDFYDLSALARNVLYNICREQINQNITENIDDSYYNDNIKDGSKIYVPCNIDNLERFKEIVNTCKDLLIILREKYWGEIIDDILHNNHLQYVQGFLDERYPDYGCIVTDVTGLGAERGEIKLKIEAFEQSLIMVLR